MFGNKIQRKQNLPYRWLAHSKWATTAAIIRPVRVSRIWCCQQLPVDFSKLMPSRDFKTSSRVVKKTRGSHLKGRGLGRGRGLYSNPWFITVCTDNRCGSHLQSQVDSKNGFCTGFRKCQLAPTVFLRAPITQMTFFNQGMSLFILFYSYCILIVHV